ncbi:hypothetical protein D3C84_943960 [compost metagenome]
MRNPDGFINRNSRCPYCSKGTSNGEKEILNYFKESDTRFNIQYKFDDCKNIFSLPFDFALFDEKDIIKFLIEFDGKQHFEPVDFGGRGQDWAEKQFIKTQHNDKIKNQYCKDNNIKLYRIPYWKFDEIEEILHKLINDEHVEVDEASFLIV